jgi:predicted small lipoprotein YifL
MMVRHFAAVLALACSACGIKGPLYLPKAPQATPASPATEPSPPASPAGALEPEKKPASVAP